MSWPSPETAYFLACDCPLDSRRSAQRRTQASSRPRRPLTSPTRAAHGWTMTEPSGSSARSHRADRRCSWSRASMMATPSGSSATAHRAPIMRTGSAAETLACIRSTSSAPPAPGARSSRQRGHPMLTQPAATPPASSTWAATARSRCPALRHTPAVTSGSAGGRRGSHSTSPTTSAADHGRSPAPTPRPSPAVR